MFPSPFNLLECGIESIFHGHLSVKYVGYFRRVFGRSLGP